MLRGVSRLVMLTLLLAVGGVGYWQYRNHTSEQRKIAQLEQDKQVLRQVVDRLTTQKRVAELLVTNRHTDESGVTVTRLLFVEYDKQGKGMAPREFTVRGEQVHIDGLVIQFSTELVEKDDPLRGHSIVLFDKIYGDRERPSEATRIDAPGRIPMIYRGTNPEVSSFEMDLWGQFWRLSEDKSYRESRGVAVANGKGLFSPLRGDRLYTITLEATGNLSYTDEPLKGAVGEALKQAFPSTTRGS